jgi:hypothetical protein
MSSIEPKSIALRFKLAITMLLTCSKPTVIIADDEIPPYLWLFHRYDPLQAYFHVRQKWIGGEPMIGSLCDWFGVFKPSARLGQSVTTTAYSSRWLRCCGSDGSQTRG